MKSQLNLIVLLLGLVLTSCNNKNKNVVFEEDKVATLDVKPTFVLTKSGVICKNWNNKKGQDLEFYYDKETFNVISAVRLERNPQLEIHHKIKTCHDKNVVKYSDCNIATLGISKVTDGKYIYKVQLKDLANKYPLDYIAITGIGHDGFLFGVKEMETYFPNLEKYISQVNKNNKRVGEL